MITDKNVRAQAIMETLREVMGESFDERLQRLGLKNALESSGEDQLKALSTLVMNRPDATIEEMEKQVAHWQAVMLAKKQIDSLAEEELMRNQQKVFEDVRMNILVKKNKSENPSTLLKYAQLVKSDSVAINAGKALRPTQSGDLIGQDKAFSAILSCLCTPYPQHMILTGPTGVGKTTAARMALESAKLSGYSPFGKGAPFVEADGATLRFDPRDGTNPLIGSVHDPIYQGARSSLASEAIPEPRTGLVTQAHGGVLFIDEIGEMDPMNLNKLLKVLEDRRVNFQSSYYDPSDENIPMYIKRLFDEGAPADFVLIGATTRSESELPAALVSRCAIINFNPLSSDMLLKIVKGAADRLSIALSESAAEQIAISAHDGREAVRILLGAHGAALREGKKVEVRHVSEAASMFCIEGEEASLPACEAGVVYALGVAGRRGCMLGVEVDIFSGDGSVSINEAAGSMAKDAAKNAFRAVNSLTGGALAGKSAVFNCMGGGNVDGPSIGMAAALALYSGLTGKPIDKDVAMTGEITLRGDILPVGEIHEKLRAAISMGCKKVLLPSANQRDAVGFGITPLPVSSLKQAIELLGIG
jgi:ATP-dependent Lon protease